MNQQVIDKSILKNCYILIGIFFIVRLFFLGSLDLLVEEAYYWNYSRHMDFGYLDHPPMVAVLIKITTAILGNTELGVRSATLVCWAVTAYFIYRLTDLIDKRASHYSVFLLSVLPYYFFQSMFMTPDVPLLACWAAFLFFIYKALVLEENKSWYFAGLCLGLGMLSKYTIAILGLPTLLYMCIVPNSRKWFRRKEGYLSVLIAVLLFTPVIYWNATHEWASFVFQSTRRFKEISKFNLHYFLGILLVFILPLGVIGLLKLSHNKSLNQAELNFPTRRFLQIFAVVPVFCWGIYSCTHMIKLNWIAPSLLALLPWISIQISRNKKQLKIWIVTSFCLLLGYLYSLTLISFRVQNIIPASNLTKLIDWHDLSNQFNSIASQIENNFHDAPVFVSLELYNVASELNFYQTKSLNSGDILKNYLVAGGHILGFQALMYNYWLPDRNSLLGKTLIIISTHPDYLQAPQIVTRVTDLSPLLHVWSYTQGKKDKVERYYYRYGRLKVVAPA